MGLLRRRDPEDDEADDPPRHGVYQVEVDSERHHFHSQVPFSFWASAKVILLLSILLWWLPQSAGYMVAGYVGGRRAGAPWKAVVAALIPVFLIFGASASYDAGYGRTQIDFLSRLPTSIAMGVGAAVPFLQPYAQFVVEYLTTFVAALQTLFGMGTNGYLVTIAFAYIGGIVGDQTRREIGSKGEGAGATRVQIIQPVVERLRHEAPRHVRHRPVALPHPSRGHGGHPYALAEYRKVPAQVESHRAHRPAPRRAPREEEPEREPERPARRHGEDEAATQRFVERALRNYERSGAARHHRH